MVKRIYIYVLSFLIIGASLPSLNINAMEGNTSISYWAENEVVEALNNDLVVENLKSDYQKPIKRFEYVLLALKVLEKYGLDLKIKQSYVFKDIIGHDYEQEILKAYYAGIISGYGNDLFKPDEYITREEMSVLIVRLLISLYPNIDISNQCKQQAKYSDLDKISFWAKDSINYCYNNKIIKGTGKDINGLDIINPLGTATREEAIVLMYRLANTKGIINSDSYGIITLDGKDSGFTANNSENKTFDITYFMRNFSEKTADIILSLDNHDDIKIVDINDKFVLINSNEDITISLSKYNEGIKLEMVSLRAFNDNEVKLYKSILETINLDKDIINSVVSGIKKLKVEKTKTSEVYQNKYYINIYMDDTLSDNYYLVKYYEKF